MKLTNLLVRTSYTFFRSILKVDDIIDNALKNNFEYVCITEKNIMYSAFEFYEKAIKNNLKPIIGLELEIKDKKLFLFAKNENGYYELIKISSDLNTINKNDFSFSSNLIVLENPDLPIASFNKKEDLKILELFSSIGNIKIEDKISHLLSKDEIESLTKTQKETINSVLSNVDFQLKRPSLNMPSFSKDDDSLLHSILKEEVINYLKNNKNLNPKLYEARLKNEYNIIKNMNFSSYFLIVSDFIKWAKKNNILIGPGRGSAPGSLVSFLLKITEIDPVKNNLIFERFLNKNRISMPDIDIDIQDNKRDLLIRYITDKYGKDNVAQIITFQTLRARMSIRDIARVLEIPLKIVDQLTSVIPEDESLLNIYNRNKKVKDLIDKNFSLKKVFDYAYLIEGLPRQFSTHAAGIVLTKNNLTEHIPIQNGFSGIYQTQYSMDYVERLGLLKIDLLGLRNLSFISNILDLIEKNQNKKILLDFDKYDDKKVFKLLSSGLTKGIFQLESPGITKVLMDLKIDNFEDIVVSISLFRPGPLKNIKNYILRKHGKQTIEYLDPVLKDILTPTFGILVYQEQIMELAKIYAGFSLEEADILRRAISKKDNLLIQSLKRKFIEGSLSNNHTEKLSLKIFDYIYEFADYGFNRSHAFAYSIISYKLAYLKTYYPLEFFNELFNSFSGNVEKITQFIEEIKLFKINMLKISINDSQNNFSIQGKGIRMGLSIVKTIRTSYIEEIIAERNKALFKDYYDFIIRTSNKKISKSSIEMLIKSGALDEFSLSRKTMLENIDSILEYSKLLIKDGEINLNLKIQKPDLKIYKEEDLNKYEIESLGFSFSYAIKKIDINKEKESIEINFEKEIKAKIISIKTTKTKTKLDMAFVSAEINNKKFNLIFWPGVYSKYKNTFSVGSEIIIIAEEDKRTKSIIVKKVVN